MSDDTAPTLKCIVYWSDRRNLCTVVRDHLETLVPAPDILRAGDDAVIAFTPLTSDQLRDILRTVIDAGEGLLVAEFETWSGYGNALDAQWLLGRGH